VIICWFYVKNCISAHMTHKIFQVTSPRLETPDSPQGPRSGGTRTAPGNNQKTKLMATCNNCSHVSMCIYHCVQLLYITQHGTVLIIFLLNKHHSSDAVYRCKKYLLQLCLSWLSGTGTMQMDYTRDSAMAEGLRNAHQ